MKDYPQLTYINTVDDTQFHIHISGSVSLFSVDSNGVLTPCNKIKEMDNLKDNVNHAYRYFKERFGICYPATEEILLHIYKLLEITDMLGLESVESRNYKQFALNAEDFTIYLTFNSANEIFLSQAPRKDNTPWVETYCSSVDAAIETYYEMADKLIKAKINLLSEQINRWVELSENISVKRSKFTASKVEKP